MTTPAQLISFARRYLGVHEATGRNDGSAVHEIQSSTGAYNAPWCMSFVQFVLERTGVGYIADRTAGVFYARDWLRSRGLLTVVPAPGRLALYQAGEGHVGFVIEAYKDGTFLTIEGNHNNEVEIVHRQRGELNVIFGIVPGVTAAVQKPTGPWPKPLPAWFWLWARWKLNGSKKGSRPRTAPRVIPPWAWRRLRALKKGRAK